MFFDLTAEELRDPSIRLRRAQEVTSEARAVTSETIESQLVDTTRATELPGFSLRSGAQGGGSSTKAAEPEISARSLRADFMTQFGATSAARFGALCIDLLAICSCTMCWVLFVALQQQPDLFVDGLPSNPVLVRAGVEFILGGLLVMLLYPLCCAPFGATVGMWATQLNLETEHGTPPTLKHRIVWALLWPSSLVVSLLRFGHGRSLATRLSRTVITSSDT